MNGVGGLYERGGWRLRIRSKEVGLKTEDGSPTPALPFIFTLFCGV